MSDTPNPFGQAPIASSNETQSQPTAESSTPTASNQASSTVSKSPFDADTPGAATNDNKNTKRIIIWVVAGIIGVILITVGVIVTLKMIRVDVDDYKQAMNTLDDFRDAGVNDRIDIDSDSSVDEMNEAINEANSTLDKAQAKLDELGKMKAINKDKDIKELYIKLKEKFDSFKTESKRAFDNIKILMPLVTAMNDVDDIDYDDDNYESKLASAYQVVADKAKETKVDDSEIEKALGDISDAAGRYASYYNKRANDQTTSYSEISGASSKLSSAGRKISKALAGSELTNLASDLSTAQYKLNSKLSDKYYDLKYNN